MVRVPTHSNNLNIYDAEHSSLWDGPRFEERVQRAAERPPTVACRLEKLSGVEGVEVSAKSWSACFYTR